MHGFDDARGFGARVVCCEGLDGGGGEAGGPAREAGFEGVGCHLGLLYSVLW